MFKLIKENVQVNVQCTKRVFEALKLCHVAELHHYDGKENVRLMLILPFLEKMLKLNVESS